jgi:hypothetical protein
VVEKLGEVSGAATCSKMLAAHGGVHRAVEQYMLDSSDWLAAWAGYLFPCVLWEEALCVGSYEGMSGDDPTPLRSAVRMASSASCFALLKPTGGMDLGSQSSRIFRFGWESKSSPILLRHLRYRSVDVAGTQ